MLPDVQAMPDARGVALDAVGVEGLRYPLLVSDGQGNKRETVATVTMSVSLPDDVKGAHLSRFVDVLHAWRDQLSTDGALLMADDLRQRLGSTRASVRLSFPYFLERRAPVSSSVSFMDYQCTLTASYTGSSSEVVLRVQVPVASVCPCSKAISDRGAHNQRGQIHVDATPVNPEAGLWFDELIDIAEQAASSPVYALLKRVDERHVTMAAYDNPVFVEDMVRNVIAVLRDDRRIAWCRVRAVNDESIHHHAAFAQASWPAASWAVEGAGGDADG
jgi:GTP cyclohydrolase FolE2